MYLILLLNSNLHPKEKIKLYLIEDTNSKLGSLHDDKNLQVQPKANPNKPLFLEFLGYSGLVILNGIYCRGTPTYELINQKLLSSIFA